MLRRVYFLCLFVALLGVSFVWADSDFTATVVDADNSTNAKISFGLNEVPWIWTSKTNTSDGELFHYLYTTWYIVDPLNLTLNYQGYSVVPGTTQQNSWTTLSSYNWSSITAPVENWQAIITLNSIHPPIFDQQNSTFLCSDCSSTTKCVSFTRYVPEPISASLLILGGSVLGLGIIRKRKKV